MKNPKHYFLLTLILISATVLASCAAANAPVVEPTETTAASTVPNDESPTEATTETYEPYYVENLELTALDGSKVNLYDYKGQRILLNFWATWCQYCVIEMPLLDALDQQDDVVVLAISVGEDAATVQKYIDENGYGFDVFLDEKGTLAGLFGVTGFPTSMFLGTDFEYFYSYPGMVEQETIDAIFEAIDGILEERKNQ